MTDAFSKLTGRFAAGLRSLPAGSVATAQQHLKALFPGGADAKSAVSVDEREALELAFRDRVRELVTGAGSGSSKSHAHAATAKAALELLIDVSIWCGESDYTSETTPLTLLEDLFDLTTIDECPAWFEFVRTRISTLTQSPKLWLRRNQTSLLTICNGLLRRFSKTTDAGFCGSVLMLLAHVFPVDDKSGVNINAKFHTENKTIVEGTAPVLSSSSSAAAADGDSKMDDGAATTPSAEDAKALVDFRFYRTLWELQAVFSNPPSLSDAATWKSLFAGLDTVLQAFEGSPLTEKDALASATGSSRSSFPKFLTSQRLINLQLRDPEFRRHVLLQSLVLFQHLTQLRAPKDRFVPTKQQLDTVRSTTERVERVLRATPPHGAVFTRDVREVLTREINWMAWKETKPNPCAPIEKKRVDAVNTTLELEPVDEKKTKGTMRSMRGGKQKSNSNPNKRPKRDPMGTPELARLWSADDSDEFLQGRNYTPALEDLIDELLDEEADSTIDAVSALKNDPRFTWRLLRLFEREDMNNFVKANGSLSGLIADLKKQRDEKKGIKPAAAATASSAGAVKSETPKTPAATTAASGSMKPPAPISVTSTSAASAPATAAATPAASPPLPPQSPSPTPLSAAIAAGTKTPVPAAAATATTPAAVVVKSESTPAAAATAAASAPAPATAAAGGDSVKKESAAVTAADASGGAKRKREDGMDDS